MKGKPRPKARPKNSEHTARPLPLPAVLGAAFILSLVVLVALELMAGWMLDATERSLIVLMCLLCALAARSLWARRNKFP